LCGSFSKSKGEDAYWDRDITDEQKPGDGATGEFIVFANADIGDTQRLEEAAESMAQMGSEEE
jgi:hypothetical protein